MILNYLDSVHLKTMALNGDDNERVYLYHLDKPMLKYLRKEFPTEKEWYTIGLKKYVQIKGF
ncbi:hypothetical protein [Hydrogenimonas sp.]